MLIGKGSWDNVWTIKTILRGFELVSGMKINFVKSKLYGINVGERFLEAAANFLLCKSESIPFKFLGLPVGANPRRLNTWKPVVESMLKRLSGWNGRHLSIGGRVTLINSVLSSLPLYFFSFFKAPKGVIHQLVKIQRNFLWGGGLDDKKLCWVKWEHVCLPKEKGGLGVKDLSLFNQALLSKWRWRCIVDINAVWYELLRHRYENNFRNLLSWDGASSSPKDSIWWRDVLKVGELDGELWFPKCVSSVLGDGKMIGFWKEKWCGEVPFRLLFPNLFDKEFDQNVVVADRLVGINSNRHWQWAWSSDLTTYEEEDLQALQQILLAVSMGAESEDKWRWIPEKSGIFTVKSVYSFFLSGRVMHDVNPGVLPALKSLWENDIPSKVGVFGWRLLLEKLPTRAALASR
ncbi:ribonuclease H, partial [Trifolium pratense]